MMNMYKGAAMSVNNYFVQLELDTGMCRVTRMAERLGVKVGSRGVDLVDFYQDKPAFTLGSVEVSPLSMAEAYATFAARGIHCDPIIVTKITTRTGKKLKAPDARLPAGDLQGRRRRRQQAAVGRDANGTGTRARVPDGRAQAGKTGTIDSNEAVWFAATPRRSPASR